MTINSFKPTEILSEMDEILLKILHQKESLESEINRFIDYFLFLKEYLEKRNQFEQSEKAFNELGDILFSLVNAFNVGNMQESVQIINYELENRFRNWCNVIREIVRFKVVLCGINSRSKFLQLFNKEIFEVVAFLNYPAKPIHEDVLENIAIKSIESLKEQQFDYILILEESHEKIQQDLCAIYPEEKVINFHGAANVFISKYKSLYYNKNYWFSLLYANLEKACKDKNVDMIVTGSSHSLHGIDTNLLEKETAKLCIRSQDLYYDYLLAKKAVESNRNISKCLIGLSYFSLGYDLSKSRKSVYLIDHVFYPIFKDSHHYKISDSYIRPAGIDQIYDEFIPFVPFDDEDLMRGYLSLCNFQMNPEFNNTWNKPCEDMPIEWLGKKRALLHNKSMYPETVNENKEILKEYLELLEENGIIPFIVIYPTHNLYSQYISGDMKALMYDVLNELSQRFKFKVLDFSTSSLFDLTDFADCDHLNKKGAGKMTSILNNLIYKNGK